MRRSRWCARFLCAPIALCGALAGATELPPEHECPTFAGDPGAGPAQDAAPARVTEGMVIEYASVPRLHSLLPPEVWRHRDVFLPDGMRMVIGACHRRYPPPPAYQRATEQFTGHARIDEDGNLSGYTAGLPFPIASIDPAASDAGARWAWNFELRHRGAGPSGQFRIAELAPDGDEQQSSAGSWFQIQLAHRADLADADYRVTGAEPGAWVAGGRFTQPASARGVAWQQTRPLAAAQQYELPDDVFVFVPSLGRARRAASAWVDGLYLPRYRVTNTEFGGVIPTAGLARGSGGAIASAGTAIAITEHLARGFTGLSIRPNAYAWRVLGVREVVAPLNAARSGFPLDPDRNFGPGGLSLATDRWDVRQAIVIQGALREPDRDYDWLTLYVDTETQQPLYVITERRGDHRRVGVGILAHRWSGDLPGYPAWPDGAPAAVFDPAAAVFFDESDGSGWRRESFDAHSAPLSAEELRYRTSSAFLERAR